MCSILNNCLRLWEFNPYRDKYDYNTQENLLEVINRVDSTIVTVHRNKWKNNEFKLMNYYKTLDVYFNILQIKKRK